MGNHLPARSREQRKQKTTPTRLGKKHKDKSEFVTAISRPSGSFGAIDSIAIPQATLLKRDERILHNVKVIKSSTLRRQVNFL